MKANISTALYRKIPIALLALLNNVIKKLTGNTKLADPPVKLVDMQVVADAYANAIEDAKEGSKLSREVRNALTKEVRTVLTITANYVRTTANGDPVILAGSGFGMAKTPERVGIPAAPKDLRVEMGALAGETEVRWRHVHGASSYQVLRSDSDPNVSANWKLATTTARVRFTDTGLESFKPYWYCVLAIGFAGKGAPCQWLMGRAS